MLEPIDADYLYLRGHYTRLVELRERLLGHLTVPGLRARNLGGLGRAYHRLGQVEQAIQFYRKARDIAREITDRRQEEQHLDNLGRIYRAVGQVEVAIECHRDALTIAREIGDRTGEGQHLGRLGVAYRDLGQLDRAIGYHEEALGIAREVGDHRKEGRHLGDLGSVYRRLGQVEQATEFHRQALAITREIGDRRDEGMWLNSLGLDYSVLGQLEQAIELYEQSLAIACETDDRQRETFSLIGLGKVLLTIGDLAEARQYCADALSLDASATSYQAAMALAIVLLHQRDQGADRTYADAVTRCRSMLEKASGQYVPRYVLATALVGQAVCDPSWANEDERAKLLTPALEEYQRALEICSAPGVVRDAIHDLEMIRAAGVYGLEPAFELLESHLDEPTDVKGLVDEVESVA